MIDLLREMSAGLSKFRRPFFLAAAIAAIVGLAGCSTKSGEAIVLGKDYVPAAPIIEAPNESPSPSPIETTSNPAEENESDSEVEYAIDETIGPPLDHRATTNEQWIVTVRMERDGKEIDVRMDQPQWEKLKIGDRVRVTYREGKYTHTVWSAEIK